MWRDVGHGGQDRVLLTPTIILQESIPFAVIGSNTVVEAKGRRVRGRLYPWGIVEGNAETCPWCPTNPGGDRDIVCPIYVLLSLWGLRGMWGPLTSVSPAVENLSHCDFVKLRTMLVRTHMQDLKDVTRETHYENYRTQCIQSMTRMVVKERNRKYGAGSGVPGWGWGVWGCGESPLFGVTPAHCEW